MPQSLKPELSLHRKNVTRAKALWPASCSKATLKILLELTTAFGFSVERGEIRIIDGHWYVTHSGLLRLATRRRCNSIIAEPVPQFSDPSLHRWVFKSTVRKSLRSRGL